MNLGYLNHPLCPWNLAERTVIRRPAEPGAGHWVGAPSLFQEGDTLYLTYRFRRPRGQGRGYEARIARSQDGITFEDIWAITQDQLDSPSMERFALTRVEDTYLLYVSYVDGRTNRWRIDVLEAARPDGFNPNQRLTVLTSDALHLEAVKDPVIVPAFGGLMMYASVAERLPHAKALSDAELHASQDVYTSGLIRSGTGLAFSSDGRRFAWLGMALQPQEQGWDQYTARVTTALPVPPGFLLFYDGGESVQQNFEEVTGLAVTTDLLHVQRLTPERPLLESPYGPGAFRYVDYAELHGHWYFYYEIAEADGSHSLSVSMVPQAATRRK
ncbi:MAG: hypothetical protein OWU84_09940 [Firmicutes bacterium]|nr:hypothetical protein [Bacillota bacterium]